MIPFKGIVVILLLISSSFSISIFKKVVLQIKIPKLFTSILDFFFYIKNHRCIVDFFGKSYIGNIFLKKNYLMLDPKFLLLHIIVCFIA